MKIQYEYLNKKKQDIVMYSSILVALAVSLFAIAKLFPALVAAEARNLYTIAYIVLSSVLALLLLTPLMKLKKRNRWFFVKGEAELGADSITFTPGVTIAYADIYRIVCDNTADFGRPCQKLRISYGTTAFQLWQDQHRAEDEITPFVEIARALGEKCPQLISDDYNTDIVYRQPDPEPDPDEIIYRKQ